MKTLALIAHDGKKDEMLAWAARHRQALARLRLIATGSTGALLRDRLGLSVETVQHGPYGGDAQIGARVVEGTVGAVVFLVDPLEKQPHEPDIQALLRLCNVHNVPLATNLATADCLLAAPSGDDGPG